MNGIYIESRTLLENKPAVEWLDGCGALTGASRKLSKMLQDMVHTDNTAVSFNVKQREFLNTHKEYYIENGSTHTPTALEFCQGVARILGIPEPTFGDEPTISKTETVEPVIVNLEPNTEQKMLYPNHKTYRILDSLDGIPLDTRMPLNEWIPPCKFEVLFISKDRRLLGEFVRIDFEGVIVRDKPGFHFTITDGHWMRIV